MSISASINSVDWLSTVFPRGLFDDKLWLEPDGTSNFDPRRGVLGGGFFRTIATTDNPSIVVYNYAKQELKLELFVQHYICLKKRPGSVSTTAIQHPVLGNDLVIFDIALG